MLVILIGNPIDGIEIVGPFKNHAVADDFIGANDIDDTAWLVEVADPDEYLRDLEI